MWQLRIYDRKHFWDGNYNLMELVKEVDGELDTDCIFEIDGKTYRWCACSPGDKVYGIQEIIVNTDPEEQYGEFTCPYCNSVDDDAWERSSDTEEIECGSCGSQIEYERHYEVSYTVTPVKMVEVVKL